MQYLDFYKTTRVLAEQLPRPDNVAAVGSKVPDRQPDGVPAPYLRV